MSDAPSDNYQEVLDKVVDAIVKQKEIPRDMVKADSNLEDLGLDSLDATEILFELEEQLDVDIPNDAARAMKNVAEVVDGLQRLLRGEEIEIAEPEASEAAKSETSDS